MFSFFQIKIYSLFLNLQHVYQLFKPFPPEQFIKWRSYVFLLKQMGPITENFFDKFSFYILEREVQDQELSIYVGLVFMPLLIIIFETTLKHLSNERAFCSYQGRTQK